MVRRGLIRALYHWVRDDPEAEGLREWHYSHRMTRRRAFLHLVSLQWAAQAIWVLTYNGEQFSRPGPSPLDWMDSGWWALLWGISAVVTFWVSLDRRIADSLGFAALIGPALVWAMFGGYSLVVAMATGGVFGSWTAWRIAVYWGLLAAVIRLVANWENPSIPLSPHVRAQAQEIQARTHELRAQSQWLERRVRWIQVPDERPSREPSDGEPPDGEPS